MKLQQHLQKFVYLSLIFFVFSAFGVIRITTVRHIEGTICDEFKKPLADVEIINTFNNFVAVSDANGHFRIKGKTGDKLQFVFSGKPTKTAEARYVKNFKVYFDTRAKFETDTQKALNGSKRSGKTSRSRAKKANPKFAVNLTYSNAVVGQVLDASGLPLPTANIKIEGKNIATQTDFNGFYGIDAKIGDRLVFSFIGMEEVKMKVAKHIINVVMYEDSTPLYEAVVTSMGIKKEKKALGYVAAEAIADKEMKAVAPGISIRGGKSSEKIKEREVKAGQLTAGEINDFSKWTYWEDLTKEQMGQWQLLWEMSPTFRYSVVLTNKQGFGLPNRTVHLTDNGKKIWTSRTDNTGKAELWYKPNNPSLSKVSEKLQIIDDNNRIIASTPKEINNGVNTFRYNENCSSLEKVNIAFMVDATGSMGDEIHYLQSEMSDVLARVKKTLPESELKIGSVFYRDFGDEYLVKNFDFDAIIPNAISFIKKQRAGGGGDYPEAVVEAYESAIDSLNWDDDARTKLLFVILDAPPHHSKENVAKLQKLAQSASKKGIQIIPIAASGIDKSTEYLMRAMALQTNGRYLFITNDSGIGNDHIAPSTDSYKVEMLNDLILRVILECAVVNDCDGDAQITNDKIESQLNKNLGIIWRYYPNPSTGVVAITVDKQASALSVYDITGKQVLYQQRNATEYEIDLTGFSNGIYYLKVYVGEQILYGKIVKKA